MHDSTTEGEYSSSHEPPQFNKGKSDNSSEVLSPDEISQHIHRDQWEEICESVKKMTNEMKEVLFFLLSRDGSKVATVTVSVGTSHGSHVMWSAPEAINTLMPYINSGYKIVGDLHNHPDVPSYAAAGLPTHYATCPSVSDLHPMQIERVMDFFGQKPWPRTIICFDEKADVMYANTYMKNRDLTADEDEAASFNDPLHVRNAPSNPRITFHTPMFLNPELVVRNGVISLGDIFIYTGNKASVVPNILGGLLDNKRAK